jgi:glycosidase
MNYPIRKGIISYLTRGDFSELGYALTDVINNAPAAIRNMQMNLLGTHDTERIITLLGGEPSAGRSNTYLHTARMNDIERGTAKRRIRMAYTILATVPGIPVIFYGDETALEGYHDPFNRMPYPWDRQDKKLIDFYRKIGSIRRDNDVYKDGDFNLVELTSDLLIFSRTKGGISYITVVNNTKQSISVRLDAVATALIGGTCDATSFDLEPFTAEIFSTTANNTIYIN